MVLEYKKRPNRIRPKQTLRNEAEKTINSLIRTLGVMIIALAVFSFLLNNERAQKGYDLDEMQEKNADLKKVNDELHVEIVNSTTTSEFAESAIQEGKVEAESKDFVTREDNLVD